MFDIGGWYLRANQVAQATPSLHGVASVWATYSVVLLAALLLTGWWLARSRSDTVMAAALLAPVSVAAAYVINQPIAHWISEPRPFTEYPNALVLTSRSTDPSFPSDHAVIAGAACVGLWFVSRRLGVAAGVIAATLALARVYVGVHYPADVVVGLILGGTVAALIWELFRRPGARLVGRLRASRLGSFTLRT